MNEAEKKLQEAIELIQDYPPFEYRLRYSHVVPPHVFQREIIIRERKKWWQFWK